MAARQVRRAAPPPLELALIIGNNRHMNDSKRTLHYADDDALRAAQYFRVLNPDSETWLLIAPDETTRAGSLGDLGFSYQAPTRKNFDAAVAAIGQRVKAAKKAGVTRIQLFFFFSGHGEPGGSLHLQDDYLPRQERWKSLGSVGVTQVIELLDGCFLGDESRGPGRVRLESIFEDEPTLPIPERPPWLGYIGATSPVPESDLVRGGLLTSVALNGLLGLADLDGDHQIRFLEWGEYIQTALKGRMDPALIKVVRPRLDPLTTVVDLRRLGPLGVVLDRDFPDGLVQVTRAGTRDLIVQLHHQRGRRDDLRLPPGRYDIVRFLPLYERIGDQKVYDFHSRRQYPAGVIAVEVGPSRKILLNSSSHLRPTFLVPAFLKGQAEAPVGTEIVAISLEDELLLNSGPLGRVPSTEGLLPSPGWSFALRTANPWQAPLLSASEPEDAPVPGLAFRVARFFPLGLKGRWFFGWSPFAQYGVARHAGFATTFDEFDQPVDPATALRHQLRLGIASVQRWDGRPTRVKLEQSFAYAPGFVTVNGGIAHDEAYDLELTPDQWRYVMLGNVVVEATVTLSWPLGKRWELGPQLRVELEVPSRSMEPPLWQMSVGVEFRQTEPR